MSDGRRIPIHGDVVAEAVTYAVAFCGAGWVVIRYPGGARLLPHGGGWSTDGRNDAWFTSLSAAAAALQAQAVREEADADAR